MDTGCPVAVLPAAHGPHGPHRAGQRRWGTPVFLFLLLGARTSEMPLSCGCCRLCVWERLRGSRGRSVCFQGRGVASAVWSVGSPVGHLGVSGKGPGLRGNHLACRERGSGLSSRGTWAGRRRWRRWCIGRR